MIERVFKNKDKKKKNKDGYDAAWIGITYENKKWVTICDERVSNDLWGVYGNEAQPTKEKEEECAMVLSNSYRGHGMVNFYCNQAYAYICEL